MRGVLLVAFAAVLSACDGVNSSMDNNMLPPPNPPVVEKPSKCVVNFANSCWVATIKKVTECLNGFSGKDTFSASKEFCSNVNGKLVSFQSPLDMFLKPFDTMSTPIEFKVLPDHVNECFRVSGVGNHFDIHLSQTGETVSFDFNQDQVQFSCLDGQEVSVSVENIKGCQKAQGMEFLSTVPGMEFGPFSENGVERGYRFRFRGAPESPDVFRCYNP